MNKSKFLSQLLRAKNSVQADNGQECLICREEYSTSTSEVQIRLPCNSKHTVGSSCIATWLRDHNNCPMSRHEFFPAEKSQSEVIEDLYVDLASDDDISDRGEDSDGDFRYEGGDTDFEDENMSENDGSASEEDEDMSDEDNP